MTVLPLSRWRIFLAAGLALAAMVSCGRVAAQNDDADTKRLVERLQVQPGMQVAEIGAGSGSLTVAMAREVGPTGHVYSNELSANRRSAIQAAVGRAELANVTVVEGQPSDTALPAACCDAIFMRDVYHHFGDPAAMNASLRRSLKPGGHLGIIDFPPRGREAADRRDRGSRHGVTSAAVRRELEAAGFEIVATDEPRGQRWFMVTARNPG